VKDLQESGYINATCIVVDTTDCWTIESLLKLGILDLSLGMALPSISSVTTCIHYSALGYSLQYLTESGNASASTSYMLDHSNSVSEVTDNTSFVAGYVQSVGLPYYIAETNLFSVSPVPIY
jgi:hypothetical protein